MKRAFASTMILGLLLGLGLIPVLAQETQTQKISDCKKILEKSIAAMGGRDLLMKAGDTKVTSEAKTSTGLNATIISYTKGFEKIRRETKIMGTNMVEIYNGKTGWAASPQMRSAMDLPEPMLRDLKKSAIGNLPLLDPDELGIRTTSEGRKTIEGKEYLVLKQTYEDESVTTLYIDSITYLPYKTVSLMLNGQLQNVEAENILSDYRDVDGIKVPFATKIMQGGKEYATVTTSECQFHLKLADSLFEKPSASTQEVVKPFVGTWKLNLAKSTSAQIPVGPKLKEKIFIVRELNPDEFECSATESMADGSSSSRKYIVLWPGGVRKYLQGGPSVDAFSTIDTFIDANNAYSIALINGKQVSMTHWVISEDGKIMRGIFKQSTDKDAPPEEDVWEKQ
jgi:hypothetical protein